MAAKTTGPDPDANTREFRVGHEELVIRLSRRVHLQRFHSAEPGPTEASHDF